MTQSQGKVYDWSKCKKIFFYFEYRRKICENFLNNDENAEEKIMALKVDLKSIALKATKIS